MYSTNYNFNSFCTGIVSPSSLPEREEKLEGKKRRSTKLVTPKMETHTTSR